MLPILLVIAAGLLLTLPSLLSRYRAALPDAPRCPACRSFTTACGEFRAIEYLLPGLTDTVRRECLLCGWRGRMRLRLAPEGPYGG
jgi:hypothetical protein